MSTTRRELLLAAVVAAVCLTALFAMTRVFTDGAWVQPAASAVLLSTAAAAAGRRIGLPAVGTLLLSGVGLAVHTYVLHLPPGPLVPGPEQLAAALELFDAGLVSLRDQQAPTEPLPELVFLVSLAAWVVALVTHEVVVRLRRPGIGLIAPATLWVVPLSMPQPTPATGRTAVGFLLACALLLLLESDADLAGWARERIAPRVTVAGSVLALAAVGLGVLAPGLLPGYQQAPWLDPFGGGTNPRGYQPIVDIGDRLTLPVQRTVLRVASDRRVYLRLAALDTFDQNTWRLGPPRGGSFVPEQAELSPGDEPLPFPQPISVADTTVVDVEVVDLENIYVPVPYQAVEINGDAADEMVWSSVGEFVATGELADNELGGTLRTGVVPGLRYQVVSAIPTPTVDQLREAEPDPAVVAEWLELPGDPARWDASAAQAREVYDGTGAVSAVDRALALRYWFTTSGGFDYSLTDVGPLRGPNALESFVFDTRTGYCEYFATAMAVMLRASGIPARVAVGFLPGELVAPKDAENGIERDVYEVRTSDAHAWVEVLFPGHGWIQFDPTPRADSPTLAPEQGDLEPLLTPEEQQEFADQFDDPAPNPADELAGIPGADDTPTTTDAPTDGAATDEPGNPLLPIAAGLIGVAAVAALVADRRRDHGERRGREGALHAQRALLHTAASLGTGRREHETAVEALHRWGSEGRCDPTRAAELAHLCQQAAFAPPDVQVDGVRATELAGSVAEELRATAHRTDRFVAPVRVPLERAGATARRLTDAARDRLSV